jgi:hypothetical protein
MMMKKIFKTALKAAWVHGVCWRTASPPDAIAWQDTIVSQDHPLRKSVLWGIIARKDHKAILLSLKIAGPAAPIAPKIPASVLPGIIARKDQ